MNGKPMEYSEGSSRIIHSGYLERALFLVGDPNSGKSTQLRSIFLDQRLGNGGTILATPRPKIGYPLSNERWLHIRLSSPHESSQTKEEFFKHFEDILCRRGQISCRWNFACALQLKHRRKINSNVDEIIGEFITQFVPERVRVVILSSDCNGNRMNPTILDKLTRDLHAIDCEVTVVDATNKQANGLIFSDFFDFI